MSSTRGWLLLSLGVISGIFIAWVDSLPSWDDTGIIAGSLFLISGILTFLARRRPWLTALAVGLWVPLRALVSSGDLSMVLVLIFPFLGAYAGFYLRSFASRPPPTA